MNTYTTANKTQGRGALTAKNLEKAIDALSKMKDENSFIAKLVCIKCRKVIGYGEQSFATVHENFYCPTCHKLNKLKE